MRASYYYTLILFIFFLLSASYDLTAQCPTGNVTLNGQADIDEFLVNYPNCTQIDGNLEIKFSSVTNLNALSNLTSITGNLYMIYLQVADFSGLHNLVSIGGKLEFLFCDQVTNLVGFDNLSNIDGRLIIRNNGNILNLIGAPSLSSVGGINISNNDKLINFSGLTGLTSVLNEVYIGGGDNLESYLGFGNLTSVGGDLSLASSNLITDLNGFSSLTTVGDDLNISNLSNLANLQGIQNLTSVGGNLTISSNNSLLDLDGLQNLATIGQDLRINNLINLTNIHSLSGLVSLGDDLNLSNLPNLVNFAGLENLSSLSGDLNLYSIGITDFTGLDVVTVGGSMNIEHCDSVYNLVGLQNLETVVEELKILRNDNLLNLHGLQSLQRVGDLYIFFNPSMKNISDFNPNFTRIDYRLEIRSNPSLHKIDGFSGLTAVPSVVISSNDKLVTFFGLSNLRVISSGLSISNNDDLLSFDGLNNVDSIGSLNMENNSQLTNFDELSSAEYIQSVKIISNSELSSVQGLAGLTEVLGRIEFFGNQSLQNLNGMHNIETIGGYLEIRTHSGLTDLAGLTNLTTIGGSLYITTCNYITSLAGMDNLSSVGIYFQINSNNRLASIDLNNLEYIGNQSRIYSNPDLTNINMNKLDSIDNGTFHIYNNEKVNQLSFDNLSFIGHSLIIEDTKILNVDAFESLKSIGEHHYPQSGYGLYIHDNDSLSNLQGFRNICAIDQTIEIINNASLTDCAILPFCARIANGTSYPFTLSGNAFGCNSGSEISQGCVVPPNSYTITTTTTDQCSSIISMDISSAHGNNNELINILDSSGDILCSIDANGNDLGLTHFELFLSSTDRPSTPPIMDRDISITPSQQPISPVRVRLYYKTDEFAALQAQDNSILDYSDLSFIVTGDSCDGLAKGGSPLEQAKSGVYHFGSFFIELSTSSLSTFQAGGSCTTSLFYTDADGDGYGDFYGEGISFCQGSQIPGYVDNKLDCDDSNPNNANLQIDNNPINSGTYEGIFINSKGRVETNSSVHFLASQKIVLEAGFELELGSDFSANIDVTCGTSP